MHKQTWKAPRQGGFSLIELLITVAIIGIVSAIAMPSYTKYVVRANREAAQAELVQLANLQEKIYLNSDRYSASVSGAYTGNYGGGLGRTSGTTADGKYSIAVSPATPGQSFTLTATPVAGSRQAGDGTLSVDSTGARLWGSVPW